MQFKFDYTLDYKERKKAVEEYQDQVGIHNLSESEVNKLWKYVLFQYEKEVKARDNAEELDKRHYKALVDHSNGIKSFISAKRGTNYVEHRYAIFDEETELKNQMKKINYDTKEVIDNNIAAYENLKINLKVNVRLRDRLIENGIKTPQSHIFKSINEDIVECKKGLIVNPVNISEGVRSKYDSLSGVDLDYSNKELVKTILKNWKMISLAAENNPKNILYDIYLDFKQAHETVNLTPIQRELLEEIFDGQSVDKTQQGNFESIVKKYCSILTPSIV